VVQRPEAITERIYQHTLKINEYLTIDHPDIDLNQEGTIQLGNTEIVVIDSLADYTAVLEELFDFASLRALFPKSVSDAV